MAKLRDFKTNFSGGQLSRTFDARADLTQYQNGQRQNLNWWPLLSGGVKTRPGSQFVYGLSSVTDCRVETFSFSEGQDYPVLFYPGACRPVLTTAAGGGEMETLFGPWTAENLRELKITQAGDLMFVAHEDFRTQVIRRSGVLPSISWTISDYEFEVSTLAAGSLVYQPYWKFANPEATITPSGTTGSVTITSSEAIFTAQHVGTIIRYRGKQIQVTGYTSPTVITGTPLEVLDKGAILFFQQTGGSSSYNFKVGEIIVGRDTGIKAEVVSKIGGVIYVSQVAGDFAASSALEEVEGLSSGNVAKLTSKQSSNPLASADWDEQAFSTVRGWPSVIEFHSQRLWLGGSSSLPAHIFGSKVAAFFNFDTGDGFPDDSLQYLIADTQVNRIVDIVSGPHLQVFTDRAEFYAPQSESRPLTPENFNLLRQTNYGCSRIVRPRLFNDATLFVSKDRKTVREYTWDDRRQKYTAPPVSMLIDNEAGAITDIAVLDGGYGRPEQLAFFTNETNQMWWYHANPVEQTRAWGVWQTKGIGAADGIWRSVAVIDDQLYAVATRDALNNPAVRHILERFTFESTLDCARMKANDEGVTQSIWSFINVGLGLATGVDVVVSANITDRTAAEMLEPAGRDNAFHLGNTFSIDGSGTLNLGSKAVDNVCVGLAFEQSLESMPVEVELPDGLSIGLPKRLVSVDVVLKSTLALKQGAQRLLTYQATDDLTGPPTPAGGLYRFYNLGYDERPTISLSNDLPVPCEVLGVKAEVEV